MACCGSAGRAEPGRAGVEADFLVFLWQILSPGSEMMGLGSGRRSMKSPPLLLAALVACVIVLGFNYWIASSRSVDLQVRVCASLCLSTPEFWFCHTLCIWAWWRELCCVHFGFCCPQELSLFFP